MLSMKSILRKAGAIPFRQSSEGLQVLLITSRDTGRWVIPRGRIRKGFTAAQTAEQEALEVAGVKGSMSATPLGSFTYSKRLANGVSIPAAVEVYALRVEKELRKWPEAERRLSWTSVAEAAQLVQEEGMRMLLLRVEKILESPAATD
jgi:8-oxo-dGTP pyrophosphatase MutT (NUDIX family)